MIEMISTILSRQRDRIKPALHSLEKQRAPPKPALQAPAADRLEQEADPLRSLWADLVQRQFFGLKKEDKHAK